jgi:hypothetical protein
MSEKLHPDIESCISEFNVMIKVLYQTGAISEKEYLLAASEGPREIRERMSY